MLLYSSENLCFHPTPRTTIHRMIALRNGLSSRYCQAAMTRDKFCDWSQKPATGAGGWALRHSRRSSSSVLGEWCPPCGVIFFGL